MANKKILSSIAATIAASLCCVTPVLAVLAGSSSLASSFSWMEPYHNYLVVLTVLLLAYAWWDKLKPQNDIECACDEESGFFSGKIFLALVSVFAIIMLTFPQWGYDYFEVEDACETCAVAPETPTKKEAKKALISVSSDIVDDITDVEEELFVLRYIREEKENPTIKKGASTCSGIGYKEADELLYYARQDVVEIAPVVVKKMIDNEEDVILLDVREAEQRAEGDIYADETYAMTRGNMEFRIMNMLKNKDAVIVTWCRSGGRSVFAAQTLKRLGYKNVYSLEGGLKGWVQAGLPYENGLGVVLKVQAQ